MPTPEPTKPPPNNPPTPPGNQQPSVEGPKTIAHRDPAKEKPDLVWTSAELYKETRANGLGFNDKYRDKIIEVSGCKLFDFESYGVYGKDTITMNIDAKPSFIIVHMGDREPWAKVVPGQDFTMRGRVPLKQEDINEPLVDCIIVAPQKSPALPLTAEQLCRDAQADPKKYNGKYMIVTGEVLRKQIPGAVVLELKGDGATKVRCQIPSKLKLTVDPIMVGQKIKVVGQYVTFDKVNGVILDKALPITRNVE
jgi:hypothetical protein